MHTAACQSHPQPDLWFPHPRDRFPAEAILICESCPLRGPCVHHALERPEPYGVWGGLTEDRRADILKGHRGPRRHRPGHRTHLPVRVGA